MLPIPFGEPCGTTIYNGDGTFTKNTTDVTTSDEGWSYGNAFGDYDNDGDMDLIVANCYNASQNNNLYNNNGNENAWLVLDLEGVVSNTAAIGAIVKVKADINGNHVWQMREVSAQSGYCGQNMLPVHVGLGNAAVVDSIIITWPSGIIDIITGEEVKQIIPIKEGDYSVGVNTNLPSMFTLSPNPANNMLTINSEAKGALSIYDSVGNLVKTMQLENNNQQINIAELIAGKYYIVLSSKGLKSATTFVKM